MQNIYENVHNLLPQST